MIGYSSIQPFWWIALLVILIVLVAKELLRKNRKRLIYRLIASVVIVIGIAGILLKPSIKSVKLNKGILFTNGYDLEFLDSLNQHNKPLDTLSLTSFSPDSFSEIYLLGYGVEEHQFSLFENIHVEYLPSRIPQGIIKIEFNATVELGDELYVKGQINSDNDYTKVVLESPFGRIDSVVNQSEFTFKHIPNVEGRQLYYLEYWGDSLLIERNPVPVNVINSDAINVLMLNSYPTFEANHLKNLLAKKGHNILIRNQISRDRFTTQKINTGMDLNQLDASSLEQFDLLLVDQMTWDQLENYEKLEVERAIRNGLGLLQYGVKGNAKGIFEDFQFESIQSETVTWKGESFGKCAVKFIGDHNIVLPILDDNYTYSIYQHKGRGKIGAMLAANTYQLNLRGDSLLFNDFWSHHINRLTRIAEERVTLKTNEAYVNHSTEIEIIKTEKNGPTITYNGINLPVIQNELFPEKWSAIYWPDTVGWNELLIDSTIYYHYVYGDEDWLTMRNWKRIKSNQHYFGNRDIPAIPKTQSKELSPIWFYLLFLTAASYLWLEAKF